MTRSSYYLTDNMLTTATVHIAHTWVRATAPELKAPAALLLLLLVLLLIKLLLTALLLILTSNPAELSHLSPLRAQTHHTAKSCPPPAARTAAAAVLQAPTA